MRSIHQILLKKNILWFKLGLSFKNNKDKPMGIESLVNSQKALENY